MRTRTGRGLFYLLAIWLILLLGMLTPLTAHGGTTTRVSVASDGTQGNGDSYGYTANARPSISADGRYVAFSSVATNLVLGDTNDVCDVFVHDRQTGQTTRVSVASDGTQGNGESHSGSSAISADGRYVAFSSVATNLVPDGTNGAKDVFVHDRQTGQTTRVSVASDGTQGNSISFDPSISADGRYVTFVSWASNLISGDTNGCNDIFVHDRQTGQTTRVSVASDGTQGNNVSFYPSISADGRYVAFYSDASNLVPDGTNGAKDVFVHDRQTGQTTRVSVASDGTQGNDNSFDPSISADGRYVAFVSYASNLVSGDTNGGVHVFVHDRQTGQNTRVSVASDGTQGNSVSLDPSISADGRYVAFSSVATNLVLGDTNDVCDVFVHDRQTGQTTRVSVASDGTQGNGESHSGSSAISADGRYVAFESAADNLVNGDTTGYGDVFVHDRGPAAAPAQLDVSAISLQQVGVPFAVTITAKDQYGNTNTGFNGEVWLSGSSGKVNPEKVTLQNDAKTIPVTFYSPGLGVTLSVSGGGLYGVSNAFDVMGARLGNGIVVGQVKDLLGTPVSGATVYLQNAVSLLQMTTGANGYFEFAYIACGTYELWAVAGSSESRHRPVDVTDESPWANELILVPPPVTVKTPILLVPGILGSSDGRGGPYPTLPRKAPKWNDAKWDTDSHGLHDPGHLAGWRNLIDKLDKDRQYVYDREVFAVPYDWRMPLKEAVEKYLIPAIDHAKNKTGSPKVHIVAHSMGGLLVRTYIQNMSKTKYRGDIDRFAMVGTPNKGAANTYYLWYGGSPKYADDINEEGLYELVNFYSTTTVLMDGWLKLHWGIFGYPACQAYSKSGYYIPGNCLDAIFGNPLARLQTRKFYHDHVQSLKTLLPIYDVLAGKKTGPVADGDAEDLKDLNRNFTLNGVKAKIFEGAGKKTIAKIKVGSPSSMYPVGVPSGLPEYDYAGDGTVPVISALMNGVPSTDPERFGPHSGLINTYQGEIINFILGLQASPMMARSVPSAAPSTISTSSLKTATPSPPMLSIGLEGAVTPFLTGPDGKGIGFNPGTGALVNETATGTLKMDSASGSIGIESPADGLYTVQLKSDLSRDYAVDITYGGGAESRLFMLRGFNEAKTVTLSFSLNKGSADIVQILNTPLPPTGLQADIIAGDLKTRLTWAPSPEADVTGYRIYGSGMDEPFLSLLGTSATPVFDTAHDWASTSAIPARRYAVSAFKADGTESFLSNMAVSNDRDHDGLTDEQETAMGTNVDNADTEGDGLTDGEEYAYGTDPKLKDTDGDGYSDKKEVLADSEPTAADSVPVFASLLKGDMNGDGLVNLKDAIIVFQILSGSPSPANINYGADIGDDARFGMTEALYILQKVAGMR